MGAKDVSRREFMAVAAGSMAGLATITVIRSDRQPAMAQEEQEEQILPVEDLMREHGVLRRVLLVYEEWMRRLGLNQDEALPTLVESSQIIRSFIEDYHERLEEEYLFPRLQSAGKLVSLVNVLLEQHRAGRELTDLTLSLANTQSLAQLDSRERLVASLGDFVRMYRPHAAREDTVLFPAFHALVPKKEYEQLGEVFEKRETGLFGEHGFEQIVERVSAIENRLGIADLNMYTPRLAFTG